MTVKYIENDKNAQSDTLSQQEDTTLEDVERKTLL